MGQDNQASLQERVSSYAPDARVEPSHAGMTGAVLALMAAWLFAQLTDVPIAHAIGPMLAFAVGGFAVPYLYYAARRRRHLRELVRIELEGRARPDPSIAP